MKDPLCYQGASMKSAPQEKCPACSMPDPAYYKCNKSCKKINPKICLDPEINFFQIDLLFLV